MKVLLCLVVVMVTLSAQVRGEQSKDVKNYSTGREDFAVQEYWIYVAFQTALIPGVLAVLRFCCHCCGFTATEGKTYSNSERRNYRIAMWVVTFLIVSACSAGLASNADVSSGIGDFFDALVIAVEEARFRAQSILDAILYIDEQYWSESVDTTQAIQGAEDVVAQMTDIRDMITEYKDLFFDKVDVWRVRAIETGYITTYVLYIIASVAALLQIGKLASFLVYFIFLPQVFVFLMAGIHHYLAVVLADVCVQVDVLIHPGTYPNGTKNFIVDELCSKVNASNPAFSFIDQAMNLTIEARDSNSGNPVIVAACNEQLEVLNTTRAGIERLLDCSIFRNLIAGVEGALCETVFDGIVGLYETQWAVGIFGFFGFFIAAKGVKRFKRSAKESTSSSMMTGGSGAFAATQPQYGYQQPGYQQPMVQQQPYSPVQQPMVYQQPMQPVYQQPPVVYQQAYSPAPGYAPAPEQPMVQQQPYSPGPVNEPVIEMMEMKPTDAEAPPAYSADAKM